MSKSGESSNTINPQVARSVAASATVATCSTGGLTIESCASYLERASRFIGVSTGSYINGGKADLDKIWSQMDNIFLEDKLKNHPSPDDWRFFGFEAEGPPSFKNFAKSFEEEEKFGDKITKDEIKDGTKDVTDFQQNAINMHIVERMALHMMHEESDPLGQAAMGWMYLNRTQVDTGSGYTTGFLEPTLHNIMTAEGQFQAFADNRNYKGPLVYDLNEYIKNTSQYDSHWISRTGSTLDSWNDCQNVAKAVASAYGNPYLSSVQKREYLEKWIGNPFPETVTVKINENGQEKKVVKKVDKDLITFYIAGSSANDFVPIGGNGHHAGHDWTLYMSKGNDND